MHPDAHVIPGPPEQADRADPIGHIPTAQRLSLISWGTGSAPSLPAVDVDDSNDSNDSNDSDPEQDGNVDLTPTTTTSLRSTGAYHFVEENGRTYHGYKAGKYPLPNDAQEQSRLDLQHTLSLLTTHGKLFLAPLEKPRRALDIATGTGIWAIEFALQFPDAQILGTDLSPIQPDFVPPNCTFEIDDAEEEWTYGQPFDFVHARFVVTCFRSHENVIRSAYANLAPGGYLELQDLRLPVQFATPPPEKCALKRLIELASDGAATLGRPWTATKHYKEYMIGAGFEDVVERTFYWPFGPWARGTYYKIVGTYALEDFLVGIEGIGLKMLTMMGWKYDDIQKLVGEARQDLLNPKIHSYLEIIIVHGRKPGGVQ